MFQLHCFLPWVPCSAGGWEGHGVEGTLLLLEVGYVGQICLSTPRNWKEIVTQMLQSSGAQMAVLASVLCLCLVGMFAA